MRRSSSAAGGTQNNLFGMSGDSMRTTGDSLDGDGGSGNDTVTPDYFGTITCLFAPVSACELAIARPRYHIHRTDPGRVSAGRFYR